MNYTKKCQCEHTDYTITRWTIQFDYKYKKENLSEGNLTDFQR